MATWQTKASLRKVPRFTLKAGAHISSAWWKFADVSGSTASLSFSPQQASCPYLEWTLHKSISHVLLPSTRRTGSLWFSVALTQKRLWVVRNFWQTASTNAACHVQKFLSGKTRCQAGAISCWAMARCRRLEAFAQHPSAQHRRPSSQWFWLPWRPRQIFEGLPRPV